MHREIAKGREIVVILRRWYLMHAWATVLFLLLPFALLGGLVTLITGTLLFSKIWILVVTLALLPTLDFVAAARAAKEPFLWAFLLAAFQTIGTVHSCIEESTLFLEGEWLSALSLVWSIAWCLAFWWLANQAWRLQQQMKQYPELRAVRRLRGERRESAPGAASLRARDRHARSRRRTLRSFAWIGGVSLALFVAISYAANRANRPPDLAPTLQGLRDRWNSGDVSGVVALCRSDHSTRLESSIRRGLRSRGWEDQLPVLGDFVVTEQGSGQRVVQYSCEQGLLTLRWRLESQQWTLVSLRLPPSGSTSP